MNYDFLKDNTHWFLKNVNGFAMKTVMTYLLSIGNKDTPLDPLDLPKIR